MLLQVQIQSLVPYNIGVVELTNVLKAFLHQRNLLIVKHDGFTGVYFIPFEMQALPDNSTGSLADLLAEPVFFIEGVDIGHVV